VSQSSSHGGTVMLSDYDWAFCYSAYYPSYAGHRGDGKWHDRKKVKIALHHQATARGHRSHLFMGFMHGGSFGDRSRLLVCMATNYYAGTSGFSREFDQLLQASSVQCSTAQKVHYLSTSMGPTPAVKFLCVRCQREMYMYIELKVPSTTKAVCPSRGHQS
jgi:hypothetical protein